MAKIYTRTTPKAIRTELDKATASFTQPTPQEQKLRDRKDRQEELPIQLEELRLEDIRWRVKRRGPVTWTAYTLLFGQNIFIFFLTWHTINLPNVPAGAFVFLGTLVGATLTESAYVIRQIVVWLFKEISYTANATENK